MKSAIRKLTATSARSPPDNNDSRLIFFPGGRASTSTPVVSQLPGSVRINRPSPPGKRRREHALERYRDVGVRLRRDTLCTLSSTSSMMLEKISPSLPAGPPAARRGTGVVLPARRTPPAPAG